ncbi:N5-glutamine S-adenosyl-L-methionine-dependent methyltransferase [Streptomyces sp. YIM 130001]|uniref:DUF7059 domain-containing protein n=1 Tax=Streptomyces sp. YIM 130001 TaxID=2259644 RepID=UPI000EB84273|nr:methyltransferase [Streptomyces sp. YIM 130001]RII13522.1 N5-glutamine S-adenosyl-L-methionine-dependent methyltransferase [Streptomyces sp. YIM 130001]
MTGPLLSPEATEALRGVLMTHGYTRDGIAARIGRDAAQALNRYDPGPALEVLGADDPLGLLIELFLCGRAVPAAKADPALVPLLEPAGDGAARAAVHLRPYEAWWAVSDFPLFLRPEPYDRRPDRVPPIGPGARQLHRATPAHAVSTALDLGTGCGVQALHLSGRAGRVTATDLSPRAARFAATTAALNGLDWEVLEGDMLQPVAGRSFDLVVSNPPYAVGPGTVHSVYRDSGRPGDLLGAELAGAARELLTEGGHLQYRAQWAHVVGEDWRDRVAGWVPGGEGLDAWAVQQEVVDVRAYVDSWLEECGGEEHLGQREVWLGWFEAQKIEAVGTGTVTLRNSGRLDPVVRVEELSVEAGALHGEHVARWFERQDWLRDHDPLATVFGPGPGLRLVQEAVLGGDGAGAGSGSGAGGVDSGAGSGGWQLAEQVLRVPADGLNWRDRTSPLAVALLGACGKAAGGAGAAGGSGVAGERTRAPAEVATVVREASRAAGVAVGPAADGTAAGEAGNSGLRRPTLGEHLDRLSSGGGSDRSRLVLAVLPEVARLVERGALVPEAEQEPEWERGREQEPRPESTGWEAATTATTATADPGAETRRESQPPTQPPTQPLTQPPTQPPTQSETPPQAPPVTPHTPASFPGPLPPYVSVLAPPSGPPTPWTTSVTPMTPTAATSAPGTPAATPTASSYGRFVPFDGGFGGPVDVQPVGGEGQFGAEGTVSGTGAGDVARTGTVSGTGTGLFAGGASAPPDARPDDAVGPAPGPDGTG